jgi:putative inorganic carbon (HCO3(-)) transporter
MQLIRTAAIAVTVAVPLVISPWGQDAYSRPKVFVLYALTGTMLAGWVVLRCVARHSWRLTRAEVALWVCLLFALVSSWTTANPRLTFFGSPARYEGLLTLAAYATLYFAGAQFFASEERLRRLAVWSCGTGIIVAAYGVIQMFVPPLFAGEAFTRAWYGSFGFLRVPSTVGGAVVFGGYLSFVLPLLLAAAATATGVGRVTWLGAVFVAVLALALTLTRGAWVAAAAATIAFAAGLGRTDWRGQRVVFAAVLVAVVFSWVVLATVITTPAELSSRITAVATGSGSVASRLFIWDRTIELIRIRPVFGWGLETLREIFPYDRAMLVRYFGPRPVIVDRAHNDILQMAVSIGIPGTMGYLAFWILTVAAGVSIWRRTMGASRILALGCTAALTGYLIQAQFAFSSVAVTPIVWLFAGAVAGWETVPGRRGESDGDANRPPAA